MPNDVLDMSMDIFQSIVAGYSDRLIDLQILSIQTGYWAAYYVGSKHPKSPDKIADSFTKKRVKAPKVVPVAEVDVDTFLAREARFKSRLGR